MLRHILSEREVELPHFTIGKLLSLAGRDVANIGPGEPDFVSSSRVIAAAKKSLERGETHYTSPQGLRELREALAKKLKRENKISADPDTVMVTTGATEGILLSLLSTVDPGEGVLVPDPGFLAYRPVVEILSGMPLSVPLRSEQDFCCTAEALKEAVLPEKTRVLVVNTPSNPTGAVASRSELENIADFAVEHDLLIVADEAYEKFVWGRKHISIASLNGMDERVVTLHSFSKSHAMAGFRLGYASGPRQLIRAMTQLHVFTTIASPTVSQAAALEALHDSGFVRRIVKEYGRRRRIVMKRLAEIGLNCVEPHGAFYAFPSIAEFGMTSLQFSEKILKREKVAVIPGTEFGRHGEGFIRLSYAANPETIQNGMERIEAFVARMKKGL